jgi:predicted MFS family arabinose efflux permease
MDVMKIAVGVALGVLVGGLLLWAVAGGALLRVLGILIVLGLVPLVRAYRREQHELRP